MGKMLHFGTTEEADIRKVTLAKDLAKQAGAEQSRDALQEYYLSRGWSTCGGHQGRAQVDGVRAEG